MNITNLIYGVYILGIFLFQYSSILNWGNFAKHRIRLKRSFKEKKEIAMPQKGMRKHIYILIKATMNTNSEKMVDVFFLFTGFITIVSFYLIYRKILFHQQKAPFFEYSFLQRKGQQQLFLFYLGALLKTRVPKH